MKMKTLTAFTLIASMAAMVSCGPEPRYGVYQYVHVERNGGGNIYFDCASSAQAGAYDIRVTRYRFADADARFTLVPDSAHAPYFRSLDAALGGKLRIDGSGSLGDAPTGTWLTATMVAESASDEVGSQSLLDAIGGIESAVVEAYVP